jgi:hypothetical protein
MDDSLLSALGQLQMFLEICFFAVWTLVGAAAFRWLIRQKRAG